MPVAVRLLGATAAGNAAGPTIVLHCVQSTAVRRRRRTARPALRNPCCLFMAAHTSYPRGLTTHRLNRAAARSPVPCARAITDSLHSGSAAELRRSTLCHNCDGLGFVAIGSGPSRRSFSRIIAPKEVRAIMRAAIKDTQVVLAAARHDEREAPPSQQFLDRPPGMRSTLRRVGRVDEDAIHHPFRRNHSAPDRGSLAHLALPRHSFSHPWPARDEPLPIRSSVSAQASKQHWPI